MPFSLGLTQAGHVLKQQQPVKASCFQSPLSFLSLLTTYHKIKCQLQSLWNKRGGGRQEPPELPGDTGDIDPSKLPAARAGPEGAGWFPTMQQRALIRRPSLCPFSSPSCLRTA